MIGLDTNVLVRFLVRDDEAEYQAAARLVDALTPAAPGFITQVTLVELYWVLSRSYSYPRSTVLAVIERLLRSPALEIDDGESAVRALSLAEEGADFADALIQGAMELFGVGETVTFDRRASKALGWRLLRSES